MAMGRQGDRQGELMVMWSEMPRSPGHVFYDRLQEVLVGAGFDGFVEEACRAFYATHRRRASVSIASLPSERSWGSARGVTPETAQKQKAAPKSGQRAGRKRLMRDDTTLYQDG